MTLNRANLANWGEAPEILISPLLDEIVCQCRAIGRERLSRMAEHMSLDEIRATTGAGSGCGGCIPLLGQITGARSMSEAQLVSRTRLDRNHAVFRLRPTHQVARDAFVAARSLPCRDILLERREGARRLRRSYTLTGISAEGDVEIIVRREPNGIMSRWLHDHASLQSAHLRLGLPFGGLDLSASTVRRVIFRAGGIGITPALSWLTRLAEKELPAISVQSCQISWWARFEPGSALVARVRHVAELARWRGFDVDLHLIDTSVAGHRASEGDWQKWLAETCDPDADHIHVCGPIGFMDCAARALDAVDWPHSRRTLESFWAAPGAGACAAARPVSRVLDFNPLDEPVIASGFSLQQGRDRAQILHEATIFLRQFYFEEGAPVPIESRLVEIAASIEASGTYVQTEAEMAFGARVAWRNSARCIGRFFWKSLAVRDLRNLDAINDQALASAVFEEIRAHLVKATNGGDLRATITVFRPQMAERPDIRIINPQIILYAGYRRADGSVIGDPANVDLTDLAQALGWEGLGTRFDVLPLMIRIGDGVPHLFELPRDEVLEVAMTHPEMDTVSALGLQWFAVPAVSDLALDMGGLVYPAAPSNGFYMSTEIGSFNLSDPKRYDLLGKIADALGLDTGLDNPLWRDRAMVEMNRMVLHSFRKAGVRIMDHHALAEWFERFRMDETEQGRPVYGHWPWIVPPMSANLSQVWHDVSLRKVILKPNYFYQQRKSDIAECLALATGR